MKFVLEEPLSEANTNVFEVHPHFDEIFIRDQDLITVDIAKKYLQIKSAFKMKLWCGITRAAMRQVISCPNLAELVVFELKKSGRLSGFEGASCLSKFSCAIGGLTQADILEITKCKSLKALGAQQSKITDKSLEAILALPSLTEVDFECTNFNDHHSSIIAKSKKIEKLELGASRISKLGLQQICSMKQLKSLDIWSNNINQHDLELLSELPNLEYLSVGGHDEQTTFTAENTIPKLEKIKSLKRVWLDGIKLNTDERKYLKERYELVG